ncbi:MAG: hypothetical protein IT423_19965 [Pirellulaceae bacterium]|nr:hypothetical protein [Pirellulaceae bacterium]
MRLAKCRLLILAAKQGPVVIESSGTSYEAAPLHEQTQEMMTEKRAAEDPSANDEAIIDEQATEESAVAYHVTAFR